MSEQTFLLVLSTILVVVIVVMLGSLSAALWQLVRILREIYGIVRNVHAGSEALSEDLSNIHGKVRRGVAAAAAGLGALSRRKRSSESESEE
ncbi:MAG: hypothetical protein ACREGH_01245 [Minisyncoccia bacterium]